MNAKRAKRRTKGTEEMSKLNFTKLRCVVHFILTFQRFRSNTRVRLLSRTLVARQFVITSFLSFFRALYFVSDGLLKRRVWFIIATFLAFRVIFVFQHGHWFMLQSHLLHPDAQNSTRPAFLKLSARHRYFCTLLCQEYFTSGKLFSLFVFVA